MNIKLSFSFYTHVSQGLQGKIQSRVKATSQFMAFSCLAWAISSVLFWRMPPSFPFPTKTSMGLLSAQLHVLLALHTQGPGSKGSHFKPSKNPRRLSASLLCFNWLLEKREGLGVRTVLWYQGSLTDTCCDEQGRAAKWYQLRTVHHSPPLLPETR